MSAADNAYFFESSDGLERCYQDFGNDRPGTPLIDLPGLTRNSGDFEDLANYFGDRHRVQ